MQAVLAAGEMHSGLADFREWMYYSRQEGVGLAARRSSSLCRPSDPLMSSGYLDSHSSLRPQMPSIGLGSASETLENMGKSRRSTPDGYGQSNGGGGGGSSW